MFCWAELVFNYMVHKGSLSLCFMQVHHIIKKYSSFLEGIEVSKMDDWACVSGRKSRNLDAC